MQSSGHKKYRAPKNKHALWRQGTQKKNGGENNLSYAAFRKKTLNKRSLETKIDMSYTSPGLTKPGLLLLKMWAFVYQSAHSNQN